MMPARNDDTQGETPNIPGEVLGEQDPGDDGTPVPEVLHVHDDLDEDQPLAEQLQDLLERIKATAEDDQLRLIFENMDTILVQLPTAEWLIFKSKISLPYRFLTHFKIDICGRLAHRLRHAKMTTKEGDANDE